MFTNCQPIPELTITRSYRLKNRIRENRKAQSEKRFIRSVFNATIPVSTIDAIKIEKAILIRDLCNVCPLIYLVRKGELN